jgi:thiol-disulfide isomerase/thioredoxin
MNKLKTTMKILLLLLLPIISFAQGINFENATFYQLLSKAKSENKIIFIDAYTTWCGPCKYMEQNVFTDTEVGNYFNSHFINARFNMEEGEGLIIAKEYNITGYPTLLFIDGTGELVDIEIGSQEPKELINIAELTTMAYESFLELKKPIKDNQSVDNTFEILTMEEVNSISKILYKDEQFLKQVDEYNEGYRDPNFLYELAKNALKNNDENAKNYAREFYKIERNLLTYDNVSLMLQTIDSPQSDEFYYLQENEIEIENIFNNNEVTNKLEEILYEYALEGIDMNKPIEERVKIVENKVAKYSPNKAIDLSSFYGMTYSELDENYLLYEKYAEIYLDKNFKILNSTFLNDTAWRFFENTTNEDSLEKALKWAIYSVNLSSNSYNNDTVAHLYYKLGDKNNARIYAEISIKKGKENGNDTSITEALLSKLK